MFGALYDFVGWIFAWIMYSYHWFTFITFYSFVFGIVFLAVGDKLITFILQKAAGGYVGSKIVVKWNLVHIGFSVKHVEIQKPVMEMLKKNNVLGMPFDLLSVEVNEIGVQVVPFAYVMDGLNVQVVMHKKEQWTWNKEDNEESFKRAIESALETRLSTADTWTNTIAQKVKALKDAKKEKDVAKPAKTAPGWASFANAYVNGISLKVTNFSIGVHWSVNYTLGVEMKSFTLGKAVKKKEPKETGFVRFCRQIQVEQFALLINHANDEQHFGYVVQPMDVNIQVLMPGVIEVGLVSSESQKVLALGMELSNVCIGATPGQAASLDSLQKPLTEYSTWVTCAANEDEKRCTGMEKEESETYMKLYAEQSAYQDKTSFFAKLYMDRFDKTVVERKAKLLELEKMESAKGILFNRIKAMEWEIPSFDEAAPDVEPSDKYKADVDHFLNDPILQYQEPKTDENAMVYIHKAIIDLKIHSFAFAAKKSKEHDFFEFFVHNISSNVVQNLDNVTAKDVATELSFKIKRFGLKDSRLDAKNAFPSMMDRNDDAEECVCDVGLNMLGNGLIDLKIFAGDFSLLLIADPLFDAMNAFVAKFEEVQDEPTVDNVLDGTQTGANDTVQNKIIYVQDLPSAYSPLLIGGMLLNATIEFKGWEICLLDNPASKKSHILALKSDVLLRVESDENYELVDCTLENVALLPCKVETLEDAIRLTATEGRSILELEGDGVDLHLKYKVSLQEVKDSEGVVVDDKIQQQEKRASKSKGWHSVHTALGTPDLQVAGQTDAPVFDLIMKPSIVKHDAAAAFRHVELSVSDFAMNFSKDDVSVLMSAATRVTDSMKEDSSVVESRIAREKLKSELRSEAMRLRRAGLLKRRFKDLDADGGGSLDTTEVRGLVDSILSDNLLTQREFDATFDAFMKYVDSDDSGEVTFDEFENLVDPSETHYTTIHQGGVSLIAAEYVNPKLKRSAVPGRMAIGNASDAMNAANVSALKVFWNKYTEQCGTSRTSLHGQKAANVQKKMIRIFQNYEYAQEAWIRIVNPAIESDLEKSKWLIRRKALVEGPGNVIDVLLSSFSENESSNEADALPLGEPMYVNTEIVTQLGGLYVRVIDNLLPVGTPSIEFAVEEIDLNGKFSMWEGVDETNEDSTTTEDGRVNAGSGDFEFTIYGRYYNSRVRQIEPYLEPYQGTLIAKKDGNAPFSLTYKSDNYLHMNATSGFMDTLQQNIVSFSAPIEVASSERDHISDIGGLFWFYNATGLDVAYAVVKEIKQHGDVHSEVLGAKKVPNMEYDAWINEDSEDDDSQQKQLLKEKEMRLAFKRADVDNSGELSAREVREVLIDVLGEGNDSGIDIDEFMKEADTDGSGDVSWEEFRLAMHKTRNSSRRTITLKMDGFNEVNDVPLDILGHELVFPTVPSLDPPLSGSETIEELYLRGKKHYFAEPPTQQDISFAFLLFQKVVKIDPEYEWVESYYDDCLLRFVPSYLSVLINVDDAIGMTVTVSSSLCVKNGTNNVTEVQLLDVNGELSSHNPEQEGTSERFFKVKAFESVKIPIPLANVGNFVIRQVGETEWSDSMSLSVYEQQCKKASKSDEQKHDSLQQYKESVYTTDQTVDGQPISVVETGSGTKYGFWSISFHPQFVFENVLPCDVEYVIGQVSDVDNASENDDPHKFFEGLTSVNGRHAIVKSGKTSQISGLDLGQSAFMKIRLLSPGNESGDSGDSLLSTNAKHACAPFKIKLESSQEKFNKFEFSTTVNHGATVSMVQSWSKGHARTLTCFTQFWIQNKCGLELDYTLSKGSMQTMEQHRKYFGENTQLPLMACARLDKNPKLSILPTGDSKAKDVWNEELGEHVLKYLPKFKTCPWSSAYEIKNITSNQPMIGGDEFVVSCEVVAAPNQFNRSLIVTFYPRYVVKNKVENRSFQISPAHIDKFGNDKIKDEGKRVVTRIEPEECLILYSFQGSAKHDFGFCARDTSMVDDIDGARMSDWMPNVPLAAPDSVDMWSQGILGEGPLIRVSTQLILNTMYCTISDVSKTPSFRIENRSSIHLLRYVQVGVVCGLETIVHPLRWHSFAWQNPLAVDPRVKLFIGGSRSPITVDITSVQCLGHITPDGGKSSIYGEIYIDGSTRVLAFSDSNIYHLDRVHVGYDMMSKVSMDIGLHGFGLTIVDSQPKEMMNITVEGIRLYSESDSRGIELTLHHLQIDDMTPNALYPVLMCPLDCGYNSYRGENWVTGDPEKPFFKFDVETALGDGITVFNKFDISLGSVMMNVHLDYLLALADVLLRFIPTADRDTAIENAIDAKNQTLSSTISYPENIGRGALLYFKHWKLSNFDYDLEFRASPDDSGTGIASILGDSMAAIIGGVSHITPSFHFRSIAWDNKFFYIDELVIAVVTKIAFNVLGQWYKIVGSVELLGDPVGLASDISSGIALAGRQIRRDLDGTSEKKGRALRTLMQAMIGAPMNAVGKSTNEMGDIVKSATYFPNQEDTREPKHLGQGFLQGGSVFGKSIAQGFSGLVTKPAEGARKQGAKGFVKGVGKGVVRLAASPVVGSLGAIEKVTKSIHNTTHISDPSYFKGTRRPARQLSDDSHLRTIPESNVITEMEVHLLHGEGFKDSSNEKVYVKLMQRDTTSGKDIVIDSFSTSTIKHSSRPEWNQSRLFDVKSVDMFVQIDVYHKRRPLPKVHLGGVRFTIQEIYKTFDSIHEDILRDAKAKDALLNARKTRKGSVFDDCNICEIYDLSDGKVDDITPNITVKSLNELDEQSEIDHEDRKQELKARETSRRKKPLSSAKMGGYLDRKLYLPEIVPKPFHLIDEDGNDTEYVIFLNFRYINGMRR